MSDMTDLAIFMVQGENAYVRGDIVTARIKAQKSKRYSYFGFVIGFITLIAVTTTTGVVFRLMHG